MTSTKELRLSREELTRVSWTCADCGTEHCLDLLKDIQTANFREKNPVCGTCGKSASSNLQTVLINLWQFSNVKIDPKESIHFRVQLQD